jgi:hypothetical protein
MPEKLKEGVVSFLDVLGWKGIWVNHKNPIDSLDQFISKFKKEVIASYPDVNIDIHGFSDTIVIFTPNMGQEQFYGSVCLHSELCHWALENALKHNLPLRGAIGFGEYSYSSTKNLTMIGQVIDEISSWSEKVNWVGVILAPSVKFESMLRNIDLTESHYVIKYDSIPFKDNTKGLNLCIKWSNSKAGELLNFIKKQTYIPPDITPKYLNTILFLESQNTKDKFTLKKGATLEFDYADLSSLTVADISSDFVDIVFNTEGDTNYSILKPGESVDFNDFCIHVTSIFEGLESRLVEFEVEWY